MIWGIRRKQFLSNYSRNNSENYSILRTLFTANELSILSVRENSIKILNEGIQLLNSKAKEEDERDIIVSLVLYYNSLKALKLDPIAYFEEQINLIEEPLKVAIQEFVDKPENLKSLEAIGYKISEDEKFGLIKIPWNELSK